MNKRDSVRKWRQNTKQKLVTALGGECVCCGYNKCNASLELHHINPDEKEFSFGKMIANPTKWDIIVEEAKKCTLVCSNCHKEIHLGITTLPDILPVFIEPDPITYKKDMMDKCPVCGNDKPISNKTCSSKCAGSIARKIDWDNIDLSEYIRQGKSKSEIGRILGCSDVAVRKRMKKLNMI